MTAPLDGLLVLEVGTSPGGAFCGKLLAEYGARVVLLEPPDGAATRRTAPHAGSNLDPELTALHLYDDAGKESAVLDLSTAGSVRMLHELVSRADVVVHSLAPGEAARLGLAPDEALARWADPSLARDGRVTPGVIFAAVTPFGMEGPWAGLPATELTVSALAGYMSTVGDPGRQPLMPFAHEVEHSAGLAAAAGVLAGLTARGQDGRGDYVDISLLEVHNAALDAPVVGGYSYLGRNLERTGNLTGPFDALRAKDGFVYVAPIQEPGYQGLLLAAGRADLLEDPRLATWELRMENREYLMAELNAWASALTAAEVLGAVQEMRVPSAAATSIGQLLDEPQVEARGLLQAMDHPLAGRLRYPAAPFLSDALGLRTGRAPLLGEHQHALQELLTLPARPTRPGPPAASGTAGPKRRLPLEGVRIVDLTQVWAGPFATVMMSELGAEVIHIESPTRPDMTRFWTVNLDLEGPLWDRSAYFNQHNRGKQSLILDLAREEARETLKALVAESDILINNFSRRVMENWGFTYERMREVNPRLVYVTMPSYGTTGPHRDHVSFGDSLQAAAGIVRWRGYDAENPRRAGPIPDPYAAFTVTGLMLAALMIRGREGRSVYIDLSQRDAVVRLIGEELIAFQQSGVEPHQFENEHREYVPHRAYRCAGDDRWVAIAARHDAEWQAICRAMRRPELATDPRFATAAARRAHRGEVDTAVEAWTGTRQAKWVEAVLLQFGVPAAAVQRVDELLEHPQYLFRDFFPWCDHPVAGPRRLHTTPIFIRGLPQARTGRAAPLFGQHTREVLSRVLGMAEEEIAALEASGAAGGEPDVSGFTVWDY